MTAAAENAETRAICFTESRGIGLLAQLGAGFDGSVFETNRNSAIKSFRFLPLYERERDVYRRLKALEIREVAGCQIPNMLHAGDDLWVIEMSVVKPPFVLDFAGAYLDQRPDYPEEVYEEWLIEKEEQFESDWPRVRLIMAPQAGVGVYLADVKPGNITFR